MTILGETFEELKAQAQKVVFAVDSVEIAEDGQTAEVTLSSNLDGEVLGHPVVSLARTEESWCVVTGWAEEARLEGIAAEAKAATEGIEALLDDWKLDEAAAQIAAARAILQAIPEEKMPTSGSLVDIDLTGHETILALKREQHIAGRWSGTESTDPMTDDHNVTVFLKSLDGVPGTLGGSEPLTLIARCQERKLDVFISAPSMLDSDFRYDTISGRHRFGDEPAQKLRANESTSHKAAFLRNGRAWLALLSERDGQKWTVELPFYSKGAHAATFDLTGSTEALAKVGEACSG